MPAATRAPLEGAWWSLAEPAVFAALASSPQGLGRAEAAARAARWGPNALADVDASGPLRLAARQFASPLVLILVVAALLSLLLRDWVDAATILAIVAGSALLGFVQEWRAGVAVARLKRRLALTVRARRDGTLRRIAASGLVPGDVIELAAGDLVPADGVVIEARDCLVSQASLTGESMPVEKRAGAVAADAPLPARENCVHLGSSVRSGTACVLVVATGAHTALADVAARLAAPEAMTDFERGVRRFGELLLRLMFAIVVAVMAANQALGRPLLESLLFALALAVGLSPELLPAIVSVSLARGARRLAHLGVLVRRLDAIEDLGAIDILCTDKTGTLTVGAPALAAALDAQGVPSAGVLRLAYLNAAFETGIDNPLDAAIAAAGRAAGLDTAPWRKVDEIAYDFARRRLTVVVAEPGRDAEHLLVAKGAVAPMLAACALDEAERARLAAAARGHAEHGLRVLALATRRAPAQPRWRAADERDLAFAGWLLFSDPVKPGVHDALAALAARGVTVKMITGDSREVAAHVAREAGLDARTVLSGPELATLDDEALRQRAERTDAFVEVDPAQKERIVRALQRSGHAVGFLGDGINDAPALHAADVGISVQGAVDVARASADIVLLRRELGAVERGIVEGRRTFANTLKYLQITTSANFGNMVSMALATPLLPFLPLTATQILLNNLLSDLPALALAADRVDAAQLARAQRWNLREMRRFMLVFGLVSSAFDLLTFALLRAAFDAGAPLFHSAWFVVSLLTELAVLLVLRTRAPWQASRPAPLLATLVAAVAAVALALPYAGPLARALGLVPLPAAMLAAMLAVVAAYALATEAARRRFWCAKKVGA